MPLCQKRPKPWLDFRGGVYFIFKGTICARQCARGETTDLETAAWLPPPSDQVKNPGEFISVR